MPRTIYVVRKRHEEHELAFAWKEELLLVPSVNSFLESNEDKGKLFLGIYLVYIISTT